MFKQNLTEDEKLENCYGHIVKNGVNWLFTEDGFRVLQYLSQHPKSSEDVSKALEAMYIHIVGL